MTDVKRYTHFNDPPGGSVEQHREGDYVLWDDYKALADKLDAAKSALDGLRRGADEEIKALTSRLDASEKEVTRLGHRLDKVCDERES